MAEVLRGGDGAACEGEVPRVPRTVELRYYNLAASSTAVEPGRDNSAEKKRERPGVNSEILKQGKKCCSYW